MNARTILSVFAAALAISAKAASAEPHVVASIKPVHSLVAAVMQGAGKPVLLLNGAASPHSYSLKPSQAASLQNADLIFWIGPEMETFLARSIPVIGSKARSVELAQAEGVLRLKARSGVDFDGHDHGRGRHEDGETHAERDTHEQSGLDTHIWLDPDNAAVFVRQINAALSRADPENARLYDANAQRLAAELDRLSADVQAILEPVAGRRFIAFHDAYQHFENRFGVKAAGAVTINPEIRPGAARIREIRATVRSLGVTCIFSEPQFEPRLVSTIIEGSGARTAILDPLGATLENGPGLYPELIRAMARSMRDCLSDTS